MTSTSPKPLIVVESADRQALLRHAAERLRELLALADSRRDDALIEPWQVTTESFEQLPEAMIARIVDACAQSATGCSDIELQGYLETDRGPRVWGIVGVPSSGSPIAREPFVEAVSLSQSPDGYHLEIRITLGDEQDA